jgi:tRNA pseudouridine55 synthase
MANTPLHGLLVIDKPGLAQISNQLSTGQIGEDRLPTSHDIVQQVRRLSRQRRIGHTGTLDPMASGILVLCLGLATRLVEYYQGHDKIYLAEITLGQATDTYDATGVVTASAPPPTFTQAQLEQALATFRGPIDQIPPAYSALKQQGEALYHKARRGESITLSARQVVIYTLDLLHYSAPDRLTLRVHCSAGTYVRSLAFDLGAVLGVPAHLSGLRREAAGPFTLAEAHTLEQVATAAAQERLAEILQPPAVGLTFRRLDLDAISLQRLGQGQQVELALPAQVGELVQVFDDAGLFAGIAICLRRQVAEHTQPPVAPGSSEQPPTTTVWKAQKWFYGVTQTA